MAALGASRRVRLLECCHATILPMGSPRPCMAAAALCASLHETLHIVFGTIAGKRSGSWMMAPRRFRAASSESPSERLEGNTAVSGTGPAAGARDTRICGVGHCRNVLPREASTLVVCCGLRVGLGHLVRLGCCRRTRRFLWLGKVEKYRGEEYTFLHVSTAGRGIRVHLDCHGARFSRARQVSGPSTQHSRGHAVNEGHGEACKEGRRGLAKRSSAVTRLTPRHRGRPLNVSVRLPLGFATSRIRPRPRMSSLHFLRHLEERPPHPTSTMPAGVTFSRLIRTTAR